MVILSSLSDSYIINGDGSTRTAAQISAPSNDFADRAQSAVVADKLYLFGGSNDFRKVSIFLFFQNLTFFQDCQTRIVHDRRIDRQTQ